MVLNTTGPQLASPAGTTALITAGSFSGPGSILLSPGTTVAISLNSSTFINTIASTQYYAICSDNSPLPSWLFFDSSDLSFSGITPAASSPSQLPETYVLHVIATDVPGFSSAVFQFRLTIDLHYLEFGSEGIDINVTVGQAFNYTGLKNNLTLDGEAIEMSLITNVQAESSSWLLVDNTTLDVSGTPPQNFYQQSFWVYIQDTYGDEANTTISLSANASTLLLGFDIPSLNVTCGETMSYTIPADAFAVNDVTTSVDLGNCSSWLSYNPQNLTFTGKVPESWLPQVYYLNLTVSKNSQSISEEVPITINKSDAPHLASPPNVPVFPPSNTTDGAPTSTATDGDLPKADPNFARNVVVVVMLVLLVAAVGFVGCMLLWPQRKQRPLNLANTDIHGTPEAEQPGQPQLHIPSRSSIGLGEAFWRDAPTSSEALNGRNSRRHGNVYSKRPDSKVLASATQKTTSKKRRAALFNSARNFGFGHGGIPLQDRAPKHVPIRVASQAHLMAHDPNEFITTPNDSFETIAFTSNPVQPSNLLGNNTIRPVTKSPTPSEMPSPDLNSSPRAKLQSFVHERATGRNTSGLFSALRITEQGAIIPGHPSRHASLKIDKNPRTVSPDQHPARYDSQRYRNSVSSAPGKRSTRATTKKTRVTSMGEDPFFVAAPSSSSKRAAKPAASAKESPYSTDEGEWTDDADPKVEQPAVPLVWHTGSSQALSYLASPSAIIDPARTLPKTPEPVKKKVDLSTDSPLEYSSGRPVRIRAPRQRPVSVEQATTVLTRDNLTKKSLRGDIAFP